MVRDKENCKMGFGNGSTNYSFTANGTSDNVCHIARNMLSIFLETSLHLIQQPTSATFLPLIKNPTLPAQSAILLLYSAQHNMFYLPFPTVFEVSGRIRYVSPS